MLVLQVIVFLWCSFRTEFCPDIGQGKCYVIDWKSQGKSGNFVLEDLYEPCTQPYCLQRLSKTVVVSILHVLFLVNPVL